MAKVKTPNGFFHYIRKNLYLGKKQINREIAISNLNEFVNVFYVANIKVMPIFGTLLGIIRDDNLIAWDEDIDMCILKDDEPTFLNNLTNLKLNGFELVRYERIGLYSFMKNGEYIDVYVLDDIGYGVLTSNDAFFFEKDLKDTIEYNFKGINLYIPRKYEEVLEFLYGDWKTPIKYAYYNLNMFQKAIRILKIKIKNNLPDCIYYPLLKKHHKKDFDQFIQNCKKHNITLDKRLEY